MSAFRPKQSRQTKADLTKGATLVGQRIDPKTPLGKTLADLRVMYAAAGEIKMPAEDLRRRIMETSLNVEAPLDLLAAKKAKEQRARLIRERIQRTMDSVMKTEGRYPSTIGIPREALDEVREACHDFDTVFVPSD